MFKKYFVVICALLTMTWVAAPARAQTAQPVTPGFLTTSGCAGTISPCFLPYSNTNPLPVTSSGGGGGSATISTGQAVIASTGTAVQLPSKTLSNGVAIAACSGNSAAITVGPSGVTNTTSGSGNGYILAAGASVSFTITNLNAVYINGTTGSCVSYLGN